MSAALAAALVATGAAYVVAARRASRWPPARSAAFLLGLAALGAALLSPLHARAEELLSAHMGQHLLLTLVAAPLLVVGAPLTLAVRSTRAGARQALAARLRSRPLRVLASPIAAWTVFAAVTAGTHLPAFYDAALRHAWLHDLEHLLYLGSALLLWAAALAAEPVVPRASPLVRIQLLLAAMPVMTLVGVALLTVDGVAYSEYAAPGALADQRSAGTIMWLGGTLPLVAAVIAIGWTALLREERRERRRDAYAERRAAAGGGAR